MHTVFALLCFVVVIHWLIFPYPSGLLHWHCGNLTIAPVPAKQPWWIWINTSCEFIMNDCITTTKQSTTKPCAYFLGYTVQSSAVLHQHRRRPVPHYNDVIMSAMASQITSLTIVYSTFYSGTHQRKHQSSTSPAFVRGAHRWSTISRHKGPVTRKMFPFDDVIMNHNRKRKMLHSTTYQLKIQDSLYYLACLTPISIYNNDILFIWIQMNAHPLT